MNFFRRIQDKSIEGEGALRVSYASIEKERHPKAIKIWDSGLKLEREFGEDRRRHPFFSIKKSTCKERNKVTGSHVNLPLNESRIPFASIKRCVIYRENKTVVRNLEDDTNGNG